VIRYDGHISQRESSILLFVVMGTMLYLQYPSFMLLMGGPAAWQVAVIMTILALVLFVPTATLAARFPGMGLSDISEKVAGPILGSLLTLSVCVWLLFGCVLTVRTFSETFLISILPMTPPSVLILVVLLCAVYASYMGFETIVRATQVIFPLLLLGIVLVLGFAAPRSNFTLAQPFWGHSVLETLMGGIRFSGMAAEVILILVLGAAFRKHTDLQNSGLIGIASFGIMSLAVVLTLVVTFGAPDAAQSPFPMFSMARLIKLGRFFQRAESLFVLFWFLSAMVRVSALFHAAAVGIAGVLRLPYYRPLLFPMAVLVMAMGMLPKDLVTVLRLERDLMRPLGIAIMLVPLLLLVIAWIRGMRGEPQDAA